jgi:hypothetical protein
MLFAQAIEAIDQERVCQRPKQRPQTSSNYRFHCVTRSSANWLPRMLRGREPRDGKAQRRAPAIEKSFDLDARTRQA